MADAKAQWIAPKLVGLTKIGKSEGGIFYNYYEETGPAEGFEYWVPQPS